MMRIFKAIFKLKSKGIYIKLDIIGGGSCTAVKSLEANIKTLNLEDQVTLLGQIPHDEMQALLNRYKAFVLPTLRETFGMVYIEALFSGIPILYSQDRGVDGFFDDVEVGVTCDPKSINSIMRGLSILNKDSEILKKNIEEMQGSESWKRFFSAAICKSYAKILHEASQMQKENVS